jgi:hypothetical protein
LIPDPCSLAFLTSHLNHIFSQRAFNGRARFSFDCIQVQKSRCAEQSVLANARPTSMFRHVIQRDGLKPTDWYRMLNGRVFFWLTEARLETLLAAYGDRPQLVLEVDTAALLDEHGAKISLTPMNTGCTSPMAFPRGLDSFLSPGTYPYEENKRKRAGKQRRLWN